MSGNLALCTDEPPLFGEEEAARCPRASAEQLKRSASPSLRTDTTAVLPAVVPKAPVPVHTQLGLSNDALNAQLLSLQTALEGLAKDGDAPPKAALQNVVAGLAALRQRNSLSAPARPDGTKPSELVTSVARSWEELQSLCFQDSWDSRICKHRLRSVFRGVGNAKDHRLQTTIQRLGDLAHIHTVEPGMLRAFRKYAISEKDAFIRDATAWELLSTAQHHGLPTRLLDWSHNPLIAAHFVTNTPEDLDRDGAIWIVDAGELNARCEEFRKWNLARPVGARVIGVFSIDQLEDYCRDNAPTLMLPHSRISSLEAFDATQLRCAFLEPPSIDVRLIHQQGLFSVLSPDVDMDLLLTTHPECARKVIVPAWLKREVRDKLDAVGISERTLTGGLDGLCSWLRRYYSQGARVTRAAAPKTPESGTAATVFVDNEESRRSSVCWGDGL